jgi:Replicative DNA helicase
MTETLTSGLGDASASELLEQLGSSPPHSRAVPFATGFDPLDDVLQGGLRAQDLVVLGGGPGIGKTVVALQWARRMAMHGQTAIYVGYQHSPAALLRRLLAIELASLARPDEVDALIRLRTLGEEVVLGSIPTKSLTIDPLGEEAYHRLRDYGTRLHLVEGSGRTTGIAELAQIVAQRRAGATALFVDYVQRIPIIGSAPDDTARGIQIAEQLKELAMVAEVPIVALAASDRDGLMATRVRLHHLQSSTALAHEADVAILMNEKARVASVAHLSLDPVRAEQFNQWVMFSVEKNREGSPSINLEFRKDLANYRFDPHGEFMTDPLVER